MDGKWLIAGWRGYSALIFYAVRALADANARAELRELILIIERVVRGKCIMREMG